MTERLEYPVESIEANGVSILTIVLQVYNWLYEILFGHNRVESSRILGLGTVPTVIRDDLSDLTLREQFICIRVNCDLLSFRILVKKMPLIKAIFT